MILVVLHQVSIDPLKDGLYRMTRSLGGLGGSGARGDCNACSIAALANRSYPLRSAAKVSASFANLQSAAALSAFGSAAT